MLDPSESDEARPSGSGKSTTSDENESGVSVPFGGSDGSGVSGTSETSGARNATVGACSGLRTRPAALSFLPPEMTGSSGSGTDCVASWPLAGTSLVASTNTDGTSSTATVRRVVSPHTGHAATATPP